MWGATALAQRFQASLVGPGQGYRQTLREKVVAGVPGGDLHLVGFGAETDYIMSKNDFSFCHTNNGELNVARHHTRSG